MSHLSVQGEQSTSSEITALTNLAALAISGASEAIQKTGANTFANVTFGLGGGTWGSITGTLSNQTDLQSALNNKATIALDNLSAVAINVSLVSDTDNTDALGTTAIAWSDLFLGSGSVITWNSAPSTADITLTHSAGTLTFAGAGVGYIFDSNIGITVADTSNVVGLTIIQNDSTNNLRGISVTNAGTANTIFIDANGNVGTTASTSGAILITNTNNTSYAINIYSNAGASAGALMRIFADNTAFDQPLLHLATDGTAGGAANLRLDGPAPQIEFVETDQVTPAGKFEVGVNGDVLYVASRNSGDTSFEKVIEITRLANGGAIVPSATDTVTLGSSTLMFSDLFLASGAVININADWIATHSTGILTVGTGDLRVTTAGTNTASVVTVGGTQTLTSKTLTSPTLTTPSAFTTGGTITLAENTSIALDPAGSADGKFSGTTVTGTAGYTQAFGDLVYLDPTDSRWEAADANAAAAADGDSRGILGIVVVAGTDGNACTILLHGIVRADTAFPALTIGAPVYVSETAGDIVVTQPTTTDVVIRIVGVAITADEIFFNPDFTWTTHT